MKIFYVTSNNENVQNSIIEHYEENGIKAKMFYYKLRSANNIVNIEDNSLIKCEVKCNTRGPILYIYKLKRISRKLKEILEKDGCDLLFGNMLFVDGYICRYIKKILNIPYVVAVRDTDLNLSFLWKLWWLKKLGEKNIEKADAILFLSDTYRDKLISKLPKSYQAIIMGKSHIIPNGIDDYWLNNKYVERKYTKEQYYTVITAGRIIRRKNNIVVAEALELLKRKGIKVSYTIVGSAEDEEIVERLKGYTFVTLKEKMPKELLLQEFRKADIYVMPSLTETFGLVYAEAMTQGLPVIYSRDEGFDKQFEDGFVGYSVDKNSVKDVASAIERVIKNYKALSNNAIQSCERFRWNKIVKSHMEVFETITMNINMKNNLQE